MLRHLFPVVILTLPMLHGRVALGDEEQIRRLTAPEFYDPGKVQEIRLRITDSSTAAACFLFPDLSFNRVSQAGGVRFVVVFRLR